MYASVLSVALVGGDARAVRVEAHVGASKQAFKLSGLPDSALREAKDRVRAAITSSGIQFPHREVTINLAPADLQKRGSDYDLPIAMCILASAKAIPTIPTVIAVGELALDGKVRAAGSALGAAVISARRGAPCLVARESAGAVARVAGAKVYPVETLSDAVATIRTGMIGPVAVPGEAPPPGDEPDLRDVRGQAMARRALEVAAAGGHHLLLHGPPGGGKTMLARRLPGILPTLDDAEAIEVALIRSDAGLGDIISTTPPFRAPHHTATRAALVGGGSGRPTPGEISLAHRGVLFLDELAEFPRSHLDALRQPIEEGRVLISRQGASTRFKAGFQLVGATNPCPCGYWGDRRRPCSCTESERTRYRHRISGPLFDRFDLAVAVPRVSGAEYSDGGGESSESVRERVGEARALQLGRGGLNRDLSDARVRALDKTSSAERLLVKVLEQARVTARGAGRVGRVARTVADLDESGRIEESHIAEALSLRGGW